MNEPRFRTPAEMHRDDNNIAYRTGISDLFADAIEIKAAPWQIPHEGSVRVPINSATNIYYRGANALYLMMQGREDNRWISEVQAKSQVWTPAGKPLKLQYFISDDRNYDIQYLQAFNGDQIEGIASFDSSKRRFSSENARKIISRFASISHESKSFELDPDGLTRFDSKENVVFFGGKDGGDLDTLHASVTAVLQSHSHPSRRDAWKGKANVDPVLDDFRVAIASYLLAAELGLPFNPDLVSFDAEKTAALLRHDKDVFFTVANQAQRMVKVVLELDLNIKLNHPLRIDGPSSVLGPAVIHIDNNGSERVMTVPGVAFSGKLVDKTSEYWLTEHDGDGSYIKHPTALMVYEPNYSPTLGDRVFINYSPDIDAPCATIEKHKGLVQDRNPTSGRTTSPQRSNARISPGSTISR